MMERKLFYLCEIGAGLDSGMTLQVVHDYGNLSTRGWYVSLPVTCEWPGEWELFVEFVAKKGTGVVPIPYHLKQGFWRLSPIRHLKGNGGVLVIRERRHRIAGGESHGDSARYVMRLASQYGVTEGVEYLGFLHPEEVRSRAIDGSSVLLVPLGENRIARHATSPMKLIEYMATGIPVVAVGHPSVVALTRHDAAYLASTDPAEFAADIRIAVGEDEASRARRGEKAKAIASRHDHAARAAQFDSWLSRIIAG